MTFHERPLSFSVRRTHESPQTTTAVVVRTLIKKKKVSENWVFNNPLRTTPLGVAQHYSSGFLHAKLLFYMETNKMKRTENPRVGGSIPSLPTSFREAKCLYLSMQ